MSHAHGHHRGVADLQGAEHGEPASVVDSAAGHVGPGHGPHLDRVGPQAADDESTRDHVGNLGDIACGVDMGITRSKITIDDHALFAGQAGVRGQVHTRSNAHGQHDQLGVEHLPSGQGQALEASVATVGARGGLPDSQADPLRLERLAQDLTGPRVDLARQQVGARLDQSHVKPVFLQRQRGLDPHAPSAHDDRSPRQSGGGLKANRVIERTELVHARFGRRRGVQVGRRRPRGQEQPVILDGLMSLHFDSPARGIDPGHADAHALLDVVPRIQVGTKKGRRRALPGRHTGDLHAEVRTVRLLGQHQHVPVRIPYANGPRRRHARRTIADDHVSHAHSRRRLLGCLDDHPGQDPAGLGRELVDLLEHQRTRLFGARPHARGHIALRAPVALDRESSLGISLGISIDDAIGAQHDAGPTPDALLGLLNHVAALVSLHRAGDAAVDARRRIAVAAGDGDVLAIGSLQKQPMLRWGHLGHGPQKVFALGVLNGARDQAVAASGALVEMDQELLHEAKAFLYTRPAGGPLCLKSLQ